MITKQEIWNRMESFGISSSDIVTVHTSLKAIGEVENGAEGLLDGMRSYLSDGILLIPTHTFRSVNAKSPYFDVKKTEPCIGVLPKIAMLHEDGYRSLHPTHSMVGFGRHAKEYLQGEEKSVTPTPVGGALSRLYEEKGKILLIGVDQNRNTYLHSVEERLEIQNRIAKEAFVVHISDESGHVFDTKPYHPHAISGLSEHYMKCKDAFVYAGATQERTLGKGVVTCCDVVKLTDCFLHLWKQAKGDLCLAYDSIPESFYK